MIFSIIKKCICKHAISIIKIVPRLCFVAITNEILKTLMGLLGVKTKSEGTELQIKRKSGQFCVNSYKMEKIDFWAHTALISNTLSSNALIY